MFVRLLLPIALLFGLAACNTAEGVGEDIEAAGEGIQQEVQ